MKNTAKVIETLKKYGKVTQGTEAVNANGIRYRYDLYQIEKPFGWLYTAFTGAVKENASKDHRNFKSDMVSAHCNFAKFKGQPHGSMGISELIILGA
jgi:hypothetical protein